MSILAANAHDGHSQIDTVFAMCHFKLMLRCTAAKVTVKVPVCAASWGLHSDAYAQEHKLAKESDFQGQDIGTVQHQTLDGCQPCVPCSTRLETSSKKLRRPGGEP